MKNVFNVLGSIGQWVAFVVMSFGIIVEVRLGADTGFIAITVGSCLFAVFTKIRYYGTKNRKKHK